VLRALRDRLTSEEADQAAAPAAEGTEAAVGKRAPVFAVLKEQLSAGEASDIVAQLPQDLKSQWARA
jgi:uncharacterized protein (DUF2267 family)